MEMIYGEANIEALCLEALNGFSTSLEDLMISWLNNFAISEDF